MSVERLRPTPSVADYRATSPEDGGGEQRGRFLQELPRRLRGRQAASNDDAQVFFLPGEAGEVSASYADGGVTSTSRVAHDPSVAGYRATSPRWRAGRNMICSLFLRLASVGDG